MMGIQNNTLGRRFDVHLNPHNPLEAKGTTKLKVEELDVVIDSFDAGFVKKSTLQWRTARTYQARCFDLRQPW